MPTLKTATEIAKDIAERHGTTCSHTTVWRMATIVLKLKPALTTTGGFQFYDAVQARKIERHLTGVLKRSAVHVPAKPTLMTTTGIHKGLPFACAHSTVWRAVKALNLKPARISHGQKFYSPPQARQIELHLAKHKAAR